MKLDLNGRLLFLSTLLCFTQLSIVESFNWTVKTGNPTMVTKGEDESLIWEFTLTAEEQAKNDLLHFMKWHKFNQSSLQYDLVGAKSYFKSFGSTAYDEPMAPHIKVDRNRQATLLINNVRREDEGTYKIEYSVELDGTLLAYQEFNITVSEPPEIGNMTSAQNVCVGSMVTLSCNATGKPMPNITWTRVGENGTDSGELASVDGFYVISNTSRSSHGTYRCTASNGVGDPVHQTTEVIVEYSSSVDNVVKSSNAVIEGHPYNLSCEVSGNPVPSVSWIKVSNDEYHVGKILNFTNIGRSDTGSYTCEASNRCGNDSKTESINVFYPPNITHIIHDRIVNETDVVLLNCTGDGNPLPTINWIRLSDNITVSKVLNIAGKQDEGLYRCTAENGIGNAATKDVNITVRYYRPLNTLLQTNTSNNSVIMNETFSITCTTEANPPAKYVIYRDETTIVGNNSVVTSSVAGRVKRVTFTCKPSNYYGVGQMAHVSLEVFYHPYITSEGPHVHQVQVGRRTSYPCPIDGNPPPDFKWYTGNGTSLLKNNGKNLSISETLSTNSGWYTCQATNKLGDKIIRLHLIVAEKPTPSSVSTTMPRSEDVYISMTSNASCEQLEEGEKKIPKAACDLVRRHGCSSWELLDGKCGSIIVEFKLEFNQSVVASEVMTTLQEAAKRGTVGGFQINSIKQISPQPPTPTEEQSCDKPFHRKNCEIHWPMVGILTGCSVVFVVVVAVIIGYYVQKRRNCRHPTKVHVSSPDVQPLSSNQGTPSDGNIYAGENGGYAKSGPLPTVDMVTEQQLGAVGGEEIPTYSTVDKSKKKDKKKDKKAAEQKEIENQYAAVDKTKKKKKKNEVDDTYAEVDMSKKSKKNPKAGEVLYADLGEFHAMQKMPEVSTSPKPLPPIKMPEAYGETQYADITQFLKEKPGDTGAEPPKESTTSAVRDTATGSKEESPAGNVGDGAEAINETGF